MVAVAFVSIFPVIRLGVIWYNFDFFGRKLTISCPVLSAVVVTSVVVLVSVDSAALNSSHCIGFHGVNGI